MGEPTESVLLLRGASTEQYRAVHSAACQDRSVQIGHYQPAAAARGCKFSPKLEPGIYARAAIISSGNASSFLRRQEDHKNQRCGQDRQSATRVLTANYCWIGKICRRRRVIPKATDWSS
jgi:hypothetical protein